MSQGASIRSAHNQSFDRLEREAGVPRTLVEFDPRRVLLHKSPPGMAGSTIQYAPSSALGVASSNRAQLEGMCDLLHTGDVFLLEY